MSDDENTFEDARSDAEAGTVCVSYSSELKSQNNNWENSLVE